MLTADLVHARRQKDELRVVPLDGERRARAHILAATYLDLVQAHVESTREEVDQALDAIRVGAADRRLADGLRKLVDDRCTFDAAPELDPVELRREVFLRATEARRAAPLGLDRDAILAEIAATRGLAPDELDRALYADLRAAHVLRAVEPIGAEALLLVYDLAQAQAVLLRAVRVVVVVRCTGAAAYRALFRKLKFLRLLHRIERRDDGYRIEIDGPFSLFEAVTRYGLKLAMLLPVLAGCDAYELEADVRWGKERRPLVYRARGGFAQSAGEADDRLPDDVAALLAALRDTEGPWRARRATAILELPGEGTCVPDLVLVHEPTGVEVYVEVMGYWSRDAVFRRVEMVQRGLPHRIVFALSERLRVSEEVLDGELPGALYVYKGVISPRTLLDRATRLLPTAG